MNDTLKQPSAQQQPKSNMNELLRRVKYQRYTKQDPKRALLELMDEVEAKVHHFRKECWNITLELLADHLGLMSNPWKYSLPHVKWKGPVSKPSYSGMNELKAKISAHLIDAYITAAKERVINLHDIPNWICQGD